MEFALYTLSVVVIVFIFFVRKSEVKKITQNELLNEYFTIMDLPFEQRTTELIRWEQKSLNLINNKKHHIQDQSKHGNIYYLDKLI
ncbi:MAG: hypothetical protein GY928_35460 [Colwellia sp.]|nr:hypothetical protein [Colwellia sp.]